MNAGVWKTLKNDPTISNFLRSSYDLKIVARHCGGQYNIKIKHFEHFSSRVNTFAKFWKFKWFYIICSSKSEKRNITKNKLQTALKEDEKLLKDLQKTLVLKGG